MSPLPLPARDRLTMRGCSKNLLLARWYVVRDTHPVPNRASLRKCHFRLEAPDLCPTVDCRGDRMGSRRRRAKTEPHGRGGGQGQEELRVLSHVRGDPLGHPAHRGAGGPARALPILIGLLPVVAAPSLADMTPTPPPSGFPPAAEPQYAAGAAAARAKERSLAAAAFTRAVRPNPAYAAGPDELGHA